MFDLFKLIQKRQALQLAFVGNYGNYCDSYRDCFGCEGDCSGSCSGTCNDTCEGYCDGCGNCGSN